MEKFPVEFADFIKKPASPDKKAQLGTNNDFVRWFPNLVKPELAKKAITLLEKHMDPFLRNWNIPIPAELITDQKENFTETLPKTFRNDSVLLNNPKSLASQKAAEIGLLHMMRSESLLRFAEKISGYQLDPKPGFQLSRYKAGDYVGPHNDHHPEDWNLRDGYVDLHITLTNPGVDRQYFIFENKGILNQAVNVSTPSGVTVSRLPYWHQVTPLIPKKGKEKTAQRWLLLVSFSIIDPPVQKK